MDAEEIRAEIANIDDCIDMTEDTIAELVDGYEQLNLQRAQMQAAISRARAKIKRYDAKKEKLNQILGGCGIP